MDRRQFFTTCRYCGKQILMTRNTETGRYTPCNPEIVRFFEDDTGTAFVNEDGKIVFGFASDTMGHVGYKKHSMFCSKRNSA